ncbi:hypothetical protein BDR07DRAFT_1537579 [Suillus spraguei]|nr:hypothetical protein BDR07DRAFT_1537579 [Suillus spraguei]
MSVNSVEKLSKIDPNNVALKDFMLFCGKGKKAGTPFEGRWVSDASPEELEEAYQDFKPDVKHLLKCAEKLSRWALHVVNELPLITYDRVALIGFFDGMDAFVLGRLLAHPLTTLFNVPAALKAYQDVRLPFAQFIAHGSERMSQFACLDIMMG